jgi:succinate dehydrogenase / fumarate reductase cytochrome b subunit
MAGDKAGLWSSVGKKALMGLTGLLLVLFIIEHLLGNLLLFSSDPDPFNKYSHTLVSLGNILVVMELGFLAFFILHIWSGITVFIGKLQARPERYHKTANAGPPSRKNVSSVTMIYTGIVLFVFVAIHLKTFKYGPYYSTLVNGVEMRDLYRLVYEVFQDPKYVTGYVLTMALLGFHLRHGFWSAFQSLGLHHPRYTPIIYTIGIIAAVVLAVGYLAIPLWIYFDPFHVRMNLAIN